MEKKEQKSPRLCSEIQLFDICEKENCGHREGRYCSDPQTLSRFEAILAEDDPSPEQFLLDEQDELDEGDDAYDSAYADEYDDEEPDLDELDEEPY